MCTPHKIQLGLLIDNCKICSACQPLSTNNADVTILAMLFLSLPYIRKNYGIIQTVKAQNYILLRNVPCRVYLILLPPHYMCNCALDVCVVCVCVRAVYLAMWVHYSHCWGIFIPYHYVCMKTSYVSCQLHRFPRQHI